jgi:hypothetical protein
MDDGATPDRDRYDAVPDVDFHGLVGAVRLDHVRATLVPQHDTGRRPFI